MSLEEILKELKSNPELFKLVVLYLNVKVKSKEYLVDLYNEGYRLVKGDVCTSIESAIKNDKESMDVIRKMVRMQTLGNGNIPTYKETSKTIKEHMVNIDVDDASEFINRNRGK